MCECPLLPTSYADCHRLLRGVKGGGGAFEGGGPEVGGGGPGGGGELGGGGGLGEVVALDERLPTIRPLRFLAMLVSANVACKHASTSCIRAMSLRCTLIDLAFPAPVHFAQRALPICQTCFIKSVRKKRSPAGHEVAPLAMVRCMELPLDHNSKLALAAL